MLLFQKKKKKRIKHGKLEEQDFLRRYQYLSVSGRLRRMNSSTYYFSDCKTEKNKEP